MDFGGYISIGFVLSNKKADLIGIKPALNILFLWVCK